MAVLCAYVYMHTGNNQHIFFNIRVRSRRNNDRIHHKLCLHQQMRRNYYNLLVEEMKLARTRASAAVAAAGEKKCK